MYAHERSLVEKYAKKPFALLGVNTDESRQEVQALVKSGTVTWRSWWDQSPEKPITTQWKVSSFPTIYLIDAKGVIRWKGPPASARSMEEVTRDLDGALDKLVAEAEAKPTS